MKNRISEIDRNLSSRGSSTMAMLAFADGYVVRINFRRPGHYAQKQRGGDP